MRVDSVPERRVDCDGIEIAYWLHGTGEPLMMITGWGTPAASWGPLPAFLDQMGYQAIVVENRDVGRSSPCDGIDYTMADMANDAVSVLDDAGIESAYLLGISMGGMIAQEMALNHPEKVRKLMLLATDPGNPERVPASLDFIGSLMQAQGDEDPKAWIVQLVAKLTGAGFIDRQRARVEAWAEARMEQGPSTEGFMRQWQAIISYGTWDRLPDLKIPTLILHGTADPLVPFANGEKLASRIPGAEFISLEGIGHLVPLEAPEETIQAIVNFFPAKTPADAR